LPVVPRGTTPDGGYLLPGDGRISCAFLQEGIGLMRARSLIVTVVVSLFLPGVVLAVWSAPALAAGAPLVDSESAGGVGITNATLQAQINPEESATAYHFEYGASASYGTSVPIPDASIAGGSSDVAVSVPVSDLQAGTSYHYRVVASNAEGATDGADLVFKTDPPASAGDESCPNAEIRQAQFSSYLPDCRAFELVSPPGTAKGGANVGADPTRTQSSLDGDAIKFDSLTSFGDDQGSETLGAEYVSQRAPDGSGWVTHGVNPEQNSRGLAIFTSSRYMAFSEDLTKAVYYALSPLTPGHPNVEKTDNLYLRSDVLAGPPGSYELLSDSITPLPARGAFSEQAETEFGAASADWSHILFESIHNLTAEAAALNPESPKAYEWHDGTLRLAGILPGGEPAAASIVGRGVGVGGEASQARHAISADGSRVVFAVPAGGLYMRIDGATTIKLNASERSEPDPNGEQPAEYAEATADDSKVFFLSTQALTDDAVVGERKLYMYDLNAPAGKHLTLISVDSEPSDNQGGYDFATGVAAISDNGEYVYFTGRNALLPGVPYTAGIHLYVWHNGTVRLVVTSNTNSGASFRGEDWGEGSLNDGDTLRVSPDGKTIVFLTTDPGIARSVGYDNISEGCHQGECRSKLNGALVCGETEGGKENCAEIYLYNYESEKLKCISCDPSGAAPVSDAGFNESVTTEEVSDVYLGGAFRTQYLNRIFSENGRYVFFDTSDALVAQDTNARRDVYEYDTQTGELHLITGGTCACDAHFVDASPDGSNLFFTTHERLVSADIDNSGDLYDARIDGGIASQNEPQPEPCTGEECQGPAPSAPAFSLPASSTFAGSGNVPAESKAVVKGRAKSPTKAQKLAQALRVCKQQARRRRGKCEARARRKYKAKQSAKRASRYSGR
jgi:hypothetical protein